MEKQENHENVRVSGLKLELKIDKTSNREFKQALAS
jgi:hypothetical protein